MNPPYKHEEVAGDYTTSPCAIPGKYRRWPGAGHLWIRNDLGPGDLPTALPQAFLHK